MPLFWGSTENGNHEKTRHQVRKSEEKMPRAYSMDLRERAIAQYHKEDMTLSKVAAIFTLGIATISRWVRQEAKTGTLAPKQGKGGRPSKLGPADRRLLEKLFEAKPDMTLEEATFEVNQKMTHPVSQSAISRAVIRLDLSRKKNILRPQT